jgi:dipeptidase E
MKLLLTSNGVTNAAIRQALRELLGRPFSESRAVFIPTAAHAVPGDKWWLIQDLNALMELGWQELDVLELTAFDGRGADAWDTALGAAQAIIVGGGVGFYLSHWLQRSGLFDRLPALLADKVYVGMSAGSMVVTPGLHADPGERVRSGRLVDDEYDETGPPDASSDRGLALVDFLVRPHLGSEFFPKITGPRMHRTAAEQGRPVYAIDDQSAIVVTGGQARVVSEGTWERFTPPPGSQSDGSRTRR